MTDDAVSRHPLRPLGTEQVRCEVLSGLSRLRLCAPRIREAKAPWEGPLGVIVSPPSFLSCGPHVCTMEMTSAGSGAGT